MDMDDDRGRTEDDSATPAATGLVRAKMGLVAHYARLGFAPVVSVLALIVAVFAVTGNQSNREKLNEAATRIESLSASQSESKGELELFRVPLAHEKSMLGEERKKQAERETKIIKNVTQLQIKMKISPTLEEQLREIARAPVVTPPIASIPVVASSVSNAASAPAVASVPEKAEKAPAVKPAVADKKPAPVPTVVNTKPAPAPASTEKATKANALKKAIEEFNKNDR
jgi:hypothetical protein